MRVVTLMCLAFAGLIGVAGSGAAVLARGQSAPPAAQPQAAPAQAAPAPAQPATAAAPPPASAGRGGVPASIRAAEKRRRSYASCNRESHNRGLRGGARRRFLIRCKLGYERRRPGQGPGQTTQPPQSPAKGTPQPAQPQPQPQQPAKRP